MVVKNDLSELDAIYNELGMLTEKHGISQEILSDLCLCMDEVFSNIVKYAYDDGKEHEIEITFSFDAGEKNMTIMISDDGKPFNPLEARSPHISTDLIDREIGGLGIFIVSNIMSSIEYSRTGSQNKLKMTKIVDDSEIIQIR